MYYEKNILCLFYSGDETMDIGFVKTCVLWRGNKGIFPLLMRDKIEFFYPKKESGSYIRPARKVEKLLHLSRIIPSPCLHYFR